MIFVIKYIKKWGNQSFILHISPVLTVAITTGESGGYKTRLLNNMGMCREVPTMNYSITDVIGSKAEEPLKTT